MADTDALYESILKGRPKPAQEATQNLVNAGMAPDVIIHDHMIRAMEEIGRRFENHQVFVPHLLLAARAMKGSLELIRPLLTSQAVELAGKIVVATVKGDLHDIGKNIVASMLEGCGFEVINLGVDVSPEKFIEAYREHQPDVIGMSALLTTTMPVMKEVIDEFEAQGLRDKVKFMIGGAPITEGYAKEIGADGYSSNANAAVAVAKSLCAV